MNNPINWVDPWGLKAYLGGHIVKVLGGHTAIILEVEPKDEPFFANDNRFTRNPKTGRLECDVSAGPSTGGKMEPYTYNTDRKGGLSKYYTSIKDPKGRSDKELFNDILKSSGKYKNDLFYDPVALGGCYNSNSYTRGILKDVGIKNPPLPANLKWFPGWTKPIPLDKDLNKKCNK